MLVGIRAVLVAVLLLRSPCQSGAGADAEQRLLEWAAEAPGWVGKVSLARNHRGAPPGELVRGLVVTEDVPRDTVVLYAPASLKLTLDTCTMPAHDRAKLQRYNQYVRSALSILHEKQRNGSRFWPYVASLPEQAPRNMFYMSRSEVEAAAGGYTTISEVLRCPQQVKQALRGVRRDATGVLSLAASAIHRLKHFILRTADKSSAASDPTWADGISDPEMRWACAMAVSRNFNGQLYPVADMINHAEDADAGLNVRPIRY
jgi:hypothetical protein